MPDMSELQEYISGLTGKEVDAAVLMLMSRYLATFNGRSGPNIQPQLGDYDADKIGKGNIAIPSNLEEQIVGTTTAAILTNMLDILSSMKTDLATLKQNSGFYTETVLYGTPTTNLGTNGTYTLSESIQNFDSIKVEMHLDTNVWWSGYREFSLRQINQARKTIGTGSSTHMLYDYDNSYCGIGFPTDTSFSFQRATRCYLAQIIGVKYNKKIF